MKNILAFAWGFLIGTLGGLIGLGGAEFRLPVLTSFFKYPMRAAIVINLAVSLVTVTFSLVFRTGGGILPLILEFAPIILNILTGSLLGSFLGVQFVTHTSEHALRRVITAALIFLSLILITHDWIPPNLGLQIPYALQIFLGLLAGFVIGIFSSALGVAGGELIIPTLTLLYGLDIKLAGTLSLAISIPTLLVGFYRYYRRQALTPLCTSKPFIAFMSFGSIGGAFVGAALLTMVSSSLVSILLGGILFVSAVNLLREKKTAPHPSGTYAHPHDSQNL